MKYVNFKRLTIKNFLSIGEEQVNIDDELKNIGGGSNSVEEYGDFIPESDEELPSPPPLPTEMEF